MRKRFCTKWNEPIELKEISGSLTCITHGEEVKCTEAQCKYSFAATMRAALFGSAGPGFGFPDYTTELKKAPAKEVAKAKGPSKICDVCTKPVYRHDAFLFHTDTILASDRYIDFVIRGWVKKGLLPSSAISGGISNEMRVRARHDVKRQGSGTPWLACKSCLSMFSVKEQDKAEAKKRAGQFWKGEKVEGVRATTKPPAGKEPVKTVKKTTEKPSETERKTPIKTPPKKWWQFWK